MVLRQYGQHSDDLIQAVGQVLTIMGVYFMPLYYKSSLHPFFSFLSFLAILIVCCYQYYIYVCVFFFNKQIL